MDDEVYLVVLLFWIVKQFIDAKSFMWKQFVGFLKIDSVKNT